MATKKQKIEMYLCVGENDDTEQIELDTNNLEADFEDFLRYKEETGRFWLYKWVLSADAELVETFEIDIQEVPEK